MKAQLPGFLKFKSANDLIRLGRDNDGGYLVSPKDVEESEILIGLGINDDWSFEKDFYSYNNVPVVAYDDSINKSIFLRQIVKSILWINNPSIFLHRLKIYFSYRSFFRGSRTHVEKFVGFEFGDKFISMKHVFETTSSSKIFLKIDIEGFEYLILGDLVAEQSRITGLVIEFHDCDLHLERIKTFIQNFSLPLVHIHANNCAPLSKEGELPLVLELTFSRNASLSNDCVLPNSLDMPNNHLAEEFDIRFA